MELFDLKVDAVNTHRNRPLVSFSFHLSFSVVGILLVFSPSQIFGISDMPDGAVGLVHVLGTLGTEREVKHSQTNP